MALDLQVGMVEAAGEVEDPRRVSSCVCGSLPAWYDASGRVYLYRRRSLAGEEEGLPMGLRCPVLWSVLSRVAGRAEGLSCLRWEVGKH